MNIYRKNKTMGEQGMLLLVLLIVMPFLILIAVYYMHLSLTSFQVARFDQLHTEAQLTADAGADYGVEQINSNGSWAGTSGETTLHSDSRLKTTYQVTVTSNSATSKTMAITGRTYWPATKTPAARSVTIYVDLLAISSGSFSVVSGEGGLSLTNNAKIAGGDVLVNGTITMSNNAQIGLTTNPVNVQVADQACPQPADGTYPRVCNSGEGAEPINLSNKAVIYGTVQATNQTDGSGMSNPGLIAGSPAPQSLPTYDRAAQKAAVTTTITAAAGSCSNGTLTWAANTKITGNVSISNSCKVAVNGNVWITGNLSLSNNSQLIVADSLGSTRPNIMIDGSSGATFSNNSSLTPNASGTGFEVYTFWSAAGCSPDCSTVTGTSLANSRSVATITLENNATASSTILYAYWSEVSMSNNGQIGALLGQTVALSNNGTITFGSSVGTGNTTWVVQGYRRH